MKGDMWERARKHGQFIVDNRATIRETARHFNISKSTVYLDVTKRIVGSPLYDKVSCVLHTNSDLRSIRGGMATKAKWEKLRMGL